MDIFNKKRVSELQAKIYSLEQKRNDLENQVYILKYKFDEIARLTENRPKDCVVGSWCKACEFSRIFHYGDCFRGSDYTATVCVKDESCKHFTPKENNHD